MNFIYCYKTFIMAENYRDILLKNGYRNMDLDTTFELTTKNGHKHYAWLWSNSKIKMVGYESYINGKYGKELYYVSPNDDMDNEKIEQLLSNVL